MGLLRDGLGRVRLAWRLLLFVVVSLIVVVVGAWIFPRGLVGASAAMLLGALAGGWLLLGVDGRGPGALGFHLARSVPREVAAGGLLGLALALGVVVAGMAFGVVGFGREGGTVGAWLSGAAAAGALLALPAAAEEALLRGYPLQALSERLGAGWGLVLTSAVFGGLHLSNPGATPLGTANTAAAGLFLGAVYLRTGSLWWATGAHLGWNWGLGYLADLPVSGLDVVDAPWVRGWVQGPAWLGGGSFGPEGSVLATVGFLAVAAVCWWGPWLRPEAAALARRPLVTLERLEGS